VSFGGGEPEEFTEGSEDLDRSLRAVDALTTLPQCPTPYDIPAEVLADHRDFRRLAPGNVRNRHPVPFFQ